MILLQSQNPGVSISALRSSKYGYMPSLVICPPTVTGHWNFEIKKFVDNLSCLIFAGKKRGSLTADNLKNYDVIISSYEVVRNDIEMLSKIQWNYCVLDEGHVIKNSKSKISLAIRQLQAEHRCASLQIIYLILFLFILLI